MSPGFTSLLEAVSQEVASSEVISSGSNSVTSSLPPIANRLTAYVEDAQHHVPIIQNGMFASFNSTNDDLLRPPTSYSAIEPRRSSYEGSVNTRATSSASLDSPANAPSDQSSPDGYISSAAMLDKSITNGAAARFEAMRKRNPFDKTSTDDPFARQVGFVGGLLGIASLEMELDEGRGEDSSRS